MIITRTRDPGITAIECAEMQPPFYDMHPMKMLYMMTKSSYRSPTLKQKSKWYVLMHSVLNYTTYSMFYTIVYTMISERTSVQCSKL